MLSHLPETYRIHRGRFHPSVCLSYGIIKLKDREPSPSEQHEGQESIKWYRVPWMAGSFLSPSPLPVVLTSHHHSAVTRLGGEEAERGAGHSPPPPDRHFGLDDSWLLGTGYRPVCCGGVSSTPQPLTTRGLQHPPPLVVIKTSPDFAKHPLEAMLPGLENP